MVTEKMIEAAQTEAVALADRAGIDIGDDRDMFVDDLAQALTRFAALSSDAEPVGWLVKTKGRSGKGTFFDIEPTFDPGICDREDYDVMPVYGNPPQPAPSVAVKALGWITCGDVTFANTPFGSYEIRPNQSSGFTGDLCELLAPGDKLASSPFANEGLAKEAAQADYEARIRSALSAQVQDVAIPDGWQLVPKEPTKEMKRADAGTSTTDAMSWNAALYRAMLAAAPAAKLEEKP